MIRFWDKVDKSGDCWLWLGYKNEKGYGRFWYKKKWQLAHRASYQMLIGDIPEGLTLDHLCRKRGCVKPEHLEVVTQKENNKRGMSPTAINARKTHCNSGHPFSGDNLHIHPNGDRRCLACRRLVDKKRREANYER